MKPSESRTHYQILNTCRNSTTEQIRDAFRRMSMIHHPDRNRNSEESNKIYRIILNSYKILSQSEKRREYDTYLNRSKYVGDFGNIEIKTLTGGFISSQLLNQINISLWEINDLINEYPDPADIREYLLRILTFLDKWVLEPGGFPDCFMEARRMQRLDPREYIRILSNPLPPGVYLPYRNLQDYFHDIRKRADKFLSRYDKLTDWNETTDQPVSLTDSLIEYNNLAVHYLSYLLNPGKESAVPEFIFSNSAFVY